MHRSFSHFHSIDWTIDHISFNFEMAVCVCAIPLSRHQSTLSSMASSASFRSFAMSFRLIGSIICHYLASQTEKKRQTNKKKQSIQPKTKAKENNSNNNNGKNSIGMQSSRCDTYRRRRRRKSNEFDEKRFVDATDAIVVCLCVWFAMRPIHRRCPALCNKAIAQNSLCAALCLASLCVSVSFSQLFAHCTCSHQFNLHNAFEPSKICIWFYSKRWYDVNTAQYIHKLSRNTMQTKVKQTTSNAKTNKKNEASAQNVGNDEKHIHVWPVDCWSF